MKKMKDRPFYVGVDIGGTKISAGLVDEKGKILATQKIPTPLRGTGQQIGKAAETLIQDLLRGHKASVADVNGIGIGVPGIVSPDHKTVVNTPNVNLSGYPLAKVLEKALKTAVILGNDVNLGLLGEKWLGVGKGVAHMVSLFPGTGVGGAIIIDGKLFCGAQGAAGELGHMIIDLDSKRESAGLFGTLEALASRRAIEQDIRDHIKQGAKSLVTKIQGGDLTVIKSQVIAECLKQKDPLMLRILDRVCYVLGHSCVSIRHIFNPDMIVLGGGVIEACGDYILPRVRKISEADPFFKGIDNCRIEPSMLGDDAVILGAVALFRQAQGQAVPEAEDYYPRLTFVKGKGILAGKLRMKGGMYIRADGKAETLSEASDLDALKKTCLLEPAVLKKVCKKKPKVLIIASVAPRVLLPAKTLQYFKEKGMALRRFSLSEAVKQYNSLKQRKAILVLDS